MKLTPKQNQVVYCLQNGWSLITDSSMAGALVSKSKEDIEFYINAGVFWNLYKKDLIFQDYNRGSWYYLTPLGESVKTKKPTII